MNNAQIKAAFKAVGFKKVAGTSNLYFENNKTNMSVVFCAVNENYKVYSGFKVVTTLPNLTAVFAYLSK